jgi:hypothetical protein
MAVSDGIKAKSFDQMLRNSSILEQFALSYPVGRLATPPGVNEDPGRFRNEAFLQKLNGCRKGEGAPHMVTLTWLPKSWGKKIEVTKVEGVADHLRTVSLEIDALPPAISSAAYPIAGVLSCRPETPVG